MACLVLGFRRRNGECKSGAGAAQQQCSQGDGDLFGVVLDKAGCKGKRIFSGLYQAVFQNLDSMV